MNRSEDRNSIDECKRVQQWVRGYHRELIDIHVRMVAKDTILSYTCIFLSIFALSVYVTYWYVEREPELLGTVLAASALILDKIIFWYMKSMKDSKALGVMIEMCGEILASCNRLVAEYTEIRDFHEFAVQGAC